MVDVQVTAMPALLFYTSFLPTLGPGFLYVMIEVLEAQ
jgi:hypothetical protein